MYKLKFLSVMLTLSLSLVACLKDKLYMDVSKTQPIIEFSYGTDATSDLGNFGMDPTQTELDTAIAINIASPQVLDYPVTVTLKIDASLLTKYNGTSGNTQLSLLPDTTYNFSTSTVTIPAGHRIARLPIKIYPGKIDPTISYGLPISVVNAKGPNGQNLLVSSNAGVAFYAFIGNPIAGPYSREWIRYNSATQTGTPAFDQTTNTLFTAISPTEISVDSGTGVTYLLSFDNNNGTLSNFHLTLDQASVTQAGITISGGPTIVTADPVSHKYEFNFQYLNSAGAARNITDKFN
jgi:Domain of unknown function (DUF1735)